MNNKEECINIINEFISSNKKCILIKGTNQYKKHKLAMALINQNYKKEKILFRINAIQNINQDEFLGWTGVKRKVKSGETIRISNNYYQFDCINKSNTWYNTDNNFKCAIVYPIDPILRSGDYEAIYNLFNNKDIEKIFLISWTDDNRYDYKEIEKLVDVVAVYDAEEEDINYHKRVLDIHNLNMLN